MKCKNCEKEFSKKYSPNSNGYFCSKSCANSFSRKQSKDGNKIVKCITCQKEIEVNIRASDKQCKCDDCRGYIKPIQTHKRLTHCLNCNEELLKYSKKKYCSYNCQTEYEFNEFIKKWKNNENNGLIAFECVSKQIRKYLFQKYNNRCSECGWGKTNQYTNKIPLEIEHIDGNHLNNKEENLTLLCPNCHSMTKTYRGANRGKGRLRKRQEYIKHCLSLKEKASLS